MAEEAERRCSTCGALVSAEAEWSGQCYSSLEPREPEAAPEGSARAAAAASPRDGSPAAAAVVPVQAREGDPAWPCPVCGNRNPIELESCAACGTPFARLLQEPEVRPDVAPLSALRWSLAFPGLGHLRCGKGFDGLARAVMFVWTAGTVAVLLVSRSGAGGLGPTVPLLSLFLVGALLVYATSALDAYRLAAGEPVLVSSRTLLWGSAGLVLLSVAVATAITVGATRSR